MSQILPYNRDVCSFRIIVHSRFLLGPQYVFKMFISWSLYQIDRIILNNSLFQFLNKPENFLLKFVDFRLTYKLFFSIDDRNIQISDYSSTILSTLKTISDRK